MLGLEGLKRYIWFLGRVRYLKDYEAHTNTNLAYFSAVRKSNMMRQNIGRADMNFTKLPRVNPKKEKITMGSSEKVMYTILKEIPKEFEKLRRWRRRNSVRNKTITGKVIFT